MACSDLSIAAIIPLYNGARWIEQSIKSVLAQTLAPDEFIVVDDGSTDDGPRIVERLAQSHPITLLRKPNGGQSSARNFGVRHSRSALIALLDQDDAWYPHHLASLIKPFRKERGVPLGWVYSNLDEVDESGGMVNKCLLDLLPRENPKRSLAGCLSDDLFILPSASLISREAFEAVGGFDEKLCGYEDDDLFLRLFRAGYDNVFIDEPLSQWRIYQSSTSYTYRMARSRMIYAMKLFEQFPDNRLERRYWTRDCIAPRFVSQTLGDCVKALERRDGEMFRTAVAHLHILLPRLSLKGRLTLSFGLICFGRFASALAAYRARAVVRPIARKLLSGSKATAAA
ncbi:MAG TPA: glycosyltransferase [Xanthobacteraceae bacterium]|jgi:glycosyltransferase involved in cell wall biosynthesis|nr:glycosyltransferase [Xanthobacteraceae bacterium]